MNNNEIIQPNELNDVLKYSKMMRSLPINYEKDADLETAFRECDQLEELMSKSYSRSTAKGNASAIANASKLK
jgi:hypothetical protein